MLALAALVVDARSATPSTAQTRRASPWRTCSRSGRSPAVSRLPSRPPDAGSPTSSPTWTTSGTCRRGGRPARVSADARQRRPGAPRALTSGAAHSSFPGLVARRPPPRVHPRGEGHGPRGDLGCGARPDDAGRRHVHGAHRAGAAVGSVGQDADRRGGAAGSAGRAVPRAIGQEHRRAHPRRSVLHRHATRRRWSSIDVTSGATTALTPTPIVLRSFQLSPTGPSHPLRRAESRRRWASSARSRTTRSCWPCRRPARAPRRARKLTERGRFSWAPDGQRLIVRSRRHADGAAGRRAARRSRGSRRSRSRSASRCGRPIASRFATLVADPSVTDPELEPVKPGMYTTAQPFMDLYLVAGRRLVEEPHRAASPIR